MEEVRANPVNNNSEREQNGTVAVRASQPSVYENINTVPLTNLSPYYGKLVFNHKLPFLEFI